MRLELGIFQINDIRPGGRTHIDEDVLFVNIDELRNILAVDSRFSKIEINLAHPGESVRIINVLDVVDPRVKVPPYFGTVAFDVTFSSILPWPDTSVVSAIVVCVAVVA